MYLFLYILLLILLVVFFRIKLKIRKQVYSKLGFTKTLYYIKFGIKSRYGNVIDFHKQYLLTIYN